MWTSKQKIFGIKQKQENYLLLSMKVELSWSGDVLLHGSGPAHNHRIHHEFYHEAECLREMGERLYKINKTETKQDPVT